MATKNGQTRRSTGKPRSEAQIAADAKRTGRPPKPAKDSVSKPITLRLTPTDYRRFINDAKRAKMSLAAYMRYCWQTTREGK